MISPIEDRRERLIELCQRFNVKRLDAFGSAAADASFNPETSDIDLLVEFERMDPVRHAKSYFSLLAALQDLFACGINLIETKAVANPYLLESIDKERTQICAA